MFRALPFGSVQGLAPCCRDSNDPLTQIDGLGRRLGRKLPELKPALVAEFSNFVEKWISVNLEPLSLNELLTFDEWIEAAPYPLHRKEELRRVHSDLHGKLPSRKVARKVKAFIKGESMPISQSLFKSARWICSRCDAAKVAMGPAFSSIERKVYQSKYFIKHVPVSDRHIRVADLRASGTQYIITDYTGFEASFSPEIMKACEVKMYSYMLKNYPDIRRFIATTIPGMNEISTRAGVHVHIKGRRMSGDMCTSLGNGFTNLMLMLFACEKYGSKVDGLVEGDDGVFAICGRVPPVSFFKDLGFELKLEKVADPSHAGFCGVVAADSGNIKDPVKFLQTFGWTMSGIDGGVKAMTELLKAKAMSAQYELPQCPIIRAVADRAFVLSGKATPRFVEDGYHSAPTGALQPFKPSPLTRALFEQLYGISAPAQIELEARIAKSSNIDFLYSSMTVDINHNLNWLWYVGE